MVVLALLALAMGGERLYATYASPRPPDVRPTRVANWKQFASRGHRIGPPNAAVTIVEFSDFQCPFCHAAEAGIRNIRQRHPNDVALIYRHYPLHQFSVSAALTAECAANFGKFEAIHDTLFAQVEQLGRKPWLDFAEEAGIRDTAEFLRCFNDDRTMQAVVLDTLAAHSVHIHGTPTFLVNDMKLSGYKDSSQLQEYVDKALRSRR